MSNNSEHAQWKILFVVMYKINFLMQAPEGIHAVCKRFPMLKLVTSEIDISLNDDLRVIPGMGEFGDRYFGTDNETDTGTSSSSSSKTPK